MTLAHVAAATAAQAATIPHRHARTTTHLATLLARRLPTAQHVLRLELSALDGYPNTASGSDRGRSSRGGISRPVEQTVTARLGLHNHKPDDGPTIDHADLYETVVGARDATRRAATTVDLDERTDWLKVAVSLLNQAHAIADRHTPPGDPNAARNHRCAGTGDADGATCHQLADYRIRDDGSISETSDHRCVDCHTAVIEREAAAELAREARRRRKQKRGVA